MNFTIDNFAKQKIAYIRAIGAYGSQNKIAMEKLKTWANKNNLFDDTTVIFGIARDNPNTTSSKDCRYDVCLAVSDDFDTSSHAEINAGYIDDGKYAVFILPHTVKAISEAWKNIFDEIEKSEYKIDISRPVLERYKQKNIKKHLCEICVAVL